MSSTIVVEHKPSLSGGEIIFAVADGRMVSCAHTAGEEWRVVNPDDSMMQLTAPSEDAALAWVNYLARLAVGDPAADIRTVVAAELRAETNPIVTESPVLAGYLAQEGIQL